MVLFRSKYYINGTVLIAVLILISGHSEVSFIFRVHSTKGSLQNNMNLYQADTLFQKKHVVSGWEREMRRPWFIEIF